MRGWDCDQGMVIRGRVMLMRSVAVLANVYVNEGWRYANEGRN